MSFVLDSLPGNMTKTAQQLVIIPKTKRVKRAQHLNAFLPYLIIHKCIYVGNEQHLVMETNVPMSKIVPSIPRLYKQN